MKIKITPGFKIQTDIYRLDIIQANQKGYAQIKQEEGHTTIVLPQTANFDSPQYQEWLNHVLAEAIRPQAQRILAKMIIEISSKYGFEFNNLTIKNIKSRWGSCSSLCNINLSLWLLLAPSHLIDYVIKHELSHLRELNHSPRFWAEVDKMTNGRAKALDKEMHDYERKLYDKGWQR